MLTALQRTTLSDISHGSVSQRKLGYGAWRIQGGNPSVVGRLISLGLAKWGPMDGDRMICVLTDVGLFAKDTPDAKA
jgi:hypothetical protein